MKATGRWGWLNQYAVPSDSELVKRARQVRGVIVKEHLAHQRGVLAAAGVPWAVEAYVLPDDATAWGQRLAAAYNGGAEFIAINAEVEWEARDAAPMLALIGAVRRIAPRAELYASVDSRGNRLGLPYQRVLAQHIAGWMPMVYPGSFQQTVGAAFASSLDGKAFGGKPVLPTIQTWDTDGATVRAQLDEVERRGLPGCQAYTMGHATEEEWSAFVSGHPRTREPVEQREGKGTMLKLAVLREEGDPFLRAWVTDGFRRYWYTSPEGLERLQSEGVFPKTVVVPAGSLADIPASARRDP